MPAVPCLHLHKAGTSTHCADKTADAASTTGAQSKPLKLSTLQLCAIKVKEVEDPGTYRILKALAGFDSPSLLRQLFAAVTCVLYGTMTFATWAFIQPHIGHLTAKIGINFIGDLFQDRQKSSQQDPSYETEHGAKEGDEEYFNGIVPSPLSHFPGPISAEAYDSEISDRE